MKYILDFDHTLFATEKFSEAAEPYKHDGQWVTPRIWDVLDAQDYFYEDSLVFLESLDPADVIILTAWTPSLGPESYEFQKVKIEKSGVMKFAAKLVILEGDKGPFVDELCGTESAVFVDDRIDHLLSAKKHCPSVQVVQMVRSDVGELPGDVSVPVAHTFAEIESLLTT